MILLPSNIFHYMRNFHGTLKLLVSTDNFLIFFLHLQGFDPVWILTFVPAEDFCTFIEFLTIVCPFVNRTQMTAEVFHASHWFKFTPLAFLCLQAGHYCKAASHSTFRNSHLMNPFIVKAFPQIKLQRVSLYWEFIHPCWKLPIQLSFTTLLTYKWFFSTVTSFTLLKGTIISKDFPALSTFIRVSLHYEFLYVL